MMTERSFRALMVNRQLHEPEMLSKNSLDGGRSSMRHSHCQQLPKVPHCPDHPGFFQDVTTHDGSWAILAIHKLNTSVRAFSIPSTEGADLRGGSRSITFAGWSAKRAIAATLGARPAPGKTPLVSQIGLESSMAAMQEIQVRIGMHA
jgi:hypothetical protein